MSIARLVLFDDGGGSRMIGMDNCSRASSQNFTCAAS